VVEDASLLRKTDDAAHINLAELESVIKGINLAISWGLVDIVIVTDSTTVHGWINSIVSELKRVKTHGIGEALARRRLNLVRDIITECRLQVEIRLVKSAENKADELTRVPRKWLRQEPESCFTAVSESITNEHAAHHFGVDRTWFLVNQHLPDLFVSRSEVADVVKNCRECQSIDPAPVVWDSGDLSVLGNWTRLAIDVTHYKKKLYLSVIDCMPGRFTLCQLLRNEGKTELINAVRVSFGSEDHQTNCCLIMEQVLHQNGFLGCARVGACTCSFGVPIGRPAME